MPYPSISKPCVMQVLPSSSPAPPLRWCPTSHPELSRYSHGDALEDHASAAICVKVSATFASKPPSAAASPRVRSAAACSRFRSAASRSSSATCVRLRVHAHLLLFVVADGCLSARPVRVLIRPVWLRARRSDAGLTLLTSVPSRVEGTNAVAVVESVGGGNPR